MSTTIRIDPRSYAKMLSALAVLPQRVGTLVIRKALNAWGGIVKRVEIAKAKKTTGLLRKSPRVKVIIPADSFNPLHRGKPARVMVGPGRDVVGPVATVNGASRVLSIKRATKHVLSGGKVRTARPSRYAHLVEAGIAGKKHITPAPFIAPAVAEGAGAGMQALSAQLGKGITEEAAKLAARS